MKGLTLPVVVACTVLDVVGCTLAVVVASTVLVVAIVEAIGGFKLVVSTTGIAVH